MVATPSPGLKKGDDIFVFYRMGKRCDASRKYFAVLDRRHGIYRPRAGISEGWVPARVFRDMDSGAKNEQVCIEYRWPYFFTMRGHMADSSIGPSGEPWTEWFYRSDVRLAADFSCPSVNADVAGLVPPGSRPELAIIAFRWGGTNECIAPQQWGSTGSSVSDVFLESFVDMAVRPRLGNDYEVWTVYVEDQSDIVKLADSVHLIFGASHPVRRALRTCAMYFLYPTAFEERCVPTMETGEDCGAGLVDQKSLFRLMKAVERAGIPSRFPHCSGLYEQLTSKRWTYILSLALQYRVPPTVALPRMLVEQNCALAADRGMNALLAVKQRQAAMQKVQPVKGPIEKGVVKLGFSWEALDVKLWEHRDGLQDALRQLAQVIEISQELTGQPHDCEAIILQEYVVHDLELRVYVVEGKVEALIYTKFCKVKDNNEFGDFQQLFSRNEAARQWMGGDFAALEDGERQCREVTDHWLGWLEAQACEMPPAIRFDYFVVRDAKKGKAVVWTLEICELGFSMLGETKLPKKVFAAMLRSCLADVPPDDMCSQLANDDLPQASATTSGQAGGPVNGSSSSSRRRRRRRAGKSGNGAEHEDAEDGGQDAAGDDEA